jgi:hypothetical protein
LVLQSNSASSAEIKISAKRISIHYTLPRNSREVDENNFILGKREGVHMNKFYSPGAAEAGLSLSKCDDSSVCLGALLSNMQ